MVRIVITHCLLLCLIASSQVALAFTGKVVGIADGDTITVLNDRQSIKVRLYGIDCPEKRQDFGSKAKQFVSDRAFGKQVEVLPIDKDRFDRTVGVVILPDGSNLNEELLKAGFAWVYSKYCRLSFCSDWKGMERTAQQSQTGLWSHENPTSPWEYRKGVRSEHTQPSRSQSDAGVYHGNRKSHVFHHSGCRYFNCKNCTVVFESRWAAVDDGYRPCGICRP